jgi:hypothetical protein
MRAGGRRTTTGVRRAAGALTVVLAVLLPLSGTLTGASASTKDNVPPTLVLTLSTLRPVAPQPGQTLVITGTLSNETTEDVSDLSLQLRMSGAVGSRSEFDSYADDPFGALPTVGLTNVTGILPAEQTRLAPGAEEPFEISVPVNSLVLPATTWQVHELGVAVSGTTTSGLLDTGALRTFLPWAPRSAPGTPLQVAWVWPLVDRPHRAVSATWLDDNLAPELTGKGRLARLLAVGSATENPPPHIPGRHRAATTRAVPVTWALDPMLVEDAGLMSRGYTVRAANGTAVAGTGRTAAGQWLAALHTGLSKADVIPLPYADPDLVAATRAGLSTQLGVATANSRTLLARELPTATLLATGWPDNGLTDQQTLDTMVGTGITSVLLSGDALPIEGAPPNETPSAHATVTTGEGELAALLTDPVLSSTVDDGADDPTQAALSLQRYLAETLMIEAEAPSDVRNVVIAPDRRWAPTARYAGALLADSGKVPWIEPVPLSTVIDSPVDTEVTRGALDYPTSARHAELRASYLRQVNALQTQLNDFGAVLTSGASTIQGYAGALQRLLSSAYRTDTTGAQTALSSIRQSLDAQMNQVRITTNAGSYITLTSHNGKVPITVSNNLDTTVHVVLKVDANQRLALANDGRETLTIPAHQAVAVSVRAVAKTSGVFPLQVRLLTPGLDGYGSTVQLYVRSTAYGTVTLIITAASTLALLIAVGVRLTRRAVRARRAAQSPA